MSAGANSLDELEVQSSKRNSGHLASQHAPFDQSLTMTLFQHASANTKTEVRTTLQSLADRVRTTEAPEKAHLPWLKLARFGNTRSTKNSLRHDANMLAITGVEADYDGGVVPFEEAAELLLKAGILALLYTSPSHTEDVPRWRVLCPFTTEMPPQRRNHQLGRLNGLFRGIFSGESWALSQSYYFGRAGLNPSHRADIIEGTPIDVHDELDMIWLGKPGASALAGAAGELGSQESREDAELVRCVVTGEHLHVELCALAARYVGRNIAGGIVEELLRGLMLSHPLHARDERWLDRYYSIPELVASALRKYRSDATEQHKTLVGLACRLIRQRRPGEEVRAAVMAAAEATGMGAVEAERIIEWAARQELKRRGSCHVG